MLLLSPSSMHPSLPEHVLREQRKTKHNVRGFLTQPFSFWEVEMFELRFLLSSGNTMHILTLANEKTYLFNRPLIMSST